MSPFTLVALCALGCVALGWLVVSFSRPGPRRAVVEWLSACAGYVALVAFFAGLFHGGLQAGSWPRMLGFGLLLGLFSAGLVVCLVQTARSLAGGGPEQQSATN